jgi:hypothetical protein
MATKSRLRLLLNGELAELFVKDVQPYMPTWFLRFLVASWMKYCGYLMRSGDVVVQQIILDRKERFMRPVTAEVEVTNEQLYANDPEFFLLHLGPRLKYSACEWPEGSEKDGFAAGLGKAEDYTVAIYQEKAGLASLPAGARVSSSAAAGALSRSPTRRASRTSPSSASRTRRRRSSSSVRAPRSGASPT